MTIADLPAVSRVELAHAPVFVLGRAQVLPSHRLYAAPDGDRLLEPRVMQVLVALAGAESAVVSRDELIDRCWEGRIVSEHAINRVVSLLRKLGAETGDFEITTVTKVGYRLIPRNGHETRTPAPEPAPDGRRRMLAAAVGLVGAVAAGGTWLLVRSRPRSPSPEALAFHRKGVEAQRQNLPDQNAQAVVHFQNAVAADPQFAEGWGALALAHRHLIETRGGADSDELARWTRSAAAKALALDPDNADAQTALILIKPYFRNWAVLESEIRAALRRHPDAWLLHANLGRVLAEVGRWRESAEAFEVAIGKDAFLPAAWARLGLAFWSAGRLHDAETVLSEAARRWPAHPAIWFTRFDFLAYGGQPDAAVALAADAPLRPLGQPPEAFDMSLRLATALATRRAADVDEAVQRLSQGPVDRAASFLAAVGRTEHLFTGLRRYYALAPDSPPLSPLTRRRTDLLFVPPLVHVRSDPQFAALTQALGLQSYWRTARGPDRA